MRKASTRLPEQGTQTPSPAPDLIPAKTENQPRTYTAIGTANGGTSSSPALRSSRITLAGFHGAMLGLTTMGMPTGLYPVEVAFCRSENRLRACQLYQRNEFEGTVIGPNRNTDCFCFGAKYSPYIPRRGQRRETLKKSALLNLRWVQLESCCSAIGSPTDGRPAIFFQMN